MGRPSVAADLFETLSQANINVRLIATSESVSCVLKYTIFKSYSVCMKNLII